MSTSPLFSIEDAPSQGFEIGDSTPPPPTTSDTAMAQANTRIALANVPRPANPIDQAQPSALYDPRLQIGAQAVGKVLSNAADYGKQTLKSVYDTSGPGAMSLVYQKNFGSPQEQDEATQRLHAAGKNAILQYLMAGDEAPTALWKKTNMIPKLLNASGQVNPETLANLQASEPALRAGGAPAKLTQAGAAEHFRGLSKGIDARIAPIVQANAAKDVSASTAQIAADLRGQITQQMTDTNPGAANAVERMAKSAENAKTLGDLDELRQQLNDKRFASKPNAITRPYIDKALNGVQDAIADHVQQVRPELPVRSMRTQQSALMKLADTFEESAAKGKAQAMSQAGLTTRQKVGQVLPDLMQAGMNPKAALAKKLIQPSTAEQLIQQAFRGRGAVGSLVRSVAPEAPGMSSLDMENMNRGGNPAEQAEIQSRIQQAGERSKRIGFNTTGVDPNAPPPEIMQAVRQARPDLFNAPPRGTETAAGAGFDNQILNSVRADHPDWSLSQQLQEAASRANKARGR